MSRIISNCNLLHLIIHLFRLVLAIICHQAQINYNLDNKIKYINNKE